MNVNVKSLLSLVLCISLCLSLGLPALAAENQAFSATLDETTFSVSQLPQTVTMTVSADPAVALESFFGTVVSDGLTIDSIASADSRFSFGSDVNTENGNIIWDGDANGSGLTQYPEVTDIVTVTFTIPAGTAAGTYNLGMDNISLTSNQAEPAAQDASVRVVLTISDDTGATDPSGPEAPAEPHNGYTAGLSTASKQLTAGDTFAVNVSVSHSDAENQKYYNAAEMTIHYDSAKLTFQEDTSTLRGATITNNAETGILALAHYGEDKVLGGNDTYSLSFQAKAEGDAAISIQSAAFIDKVGAEKDDLIPARLLPADLAVAITHSVILPEGFIGNSTVEYGEDYSFRVPNVNYDYTITAAVDGVPVPAENIHYNAETGTFTIRNVQGNLVITAQSSPKTFSVTINGETMKNDGATATYGMDYRFSIPTDVAAGLEAGTQYSVSVTIGGAAYTPANTGTDYTISGDAITGEVVITVTATSVEPNMFTVTLEGNAVHAVENTEFTVAKNTDYTLWVACIGGYNYSVSVTMAGVVQDPIVSVVDPETKVASYTVQNVTGNLVFTVNRSVDTSGVEVSKYLSLDNNHVWLITKTTTLGDGHIPTYDGNPMFRSEKYDAYCYLVISPTLNLQEDVIPKVHFSETVMDAVLVNYERDVNISGISDASDAQLVYNMYNTMYPDFTANVTMEKFLRADVNGDKTIDMQDPTAIIHAILGLSADTQ